MIIQSGRVYIINSCVTRNNLYDISHRSSFMGYAATTVSILYYNPYQNICIHRAHNDYFDYYNYNFYM